MQTTRLEMPDRLVTIQSGHDTAKLGQFIWDTYLRPQGQPAPVSNVQPGAGPTWVSNVQPGAGPTWVSNVQPGAGPTWNYAEEPALPLPSMNFGDEDLSAHHVKKQHRATEPEQPVTNSDPDVLPLPVMNFDPPGGRPQTAPAAALVKNEQEVLLLPALF